MAPPPPYARSGFVGPAMSSPEHSLLRGSSVRGAESGRTDALSARQEWFSHFWPGFRFLGLGPGERGSSLTRRLPSSAVSHATSVLFCVFFYFIKVLFFGFYFLFSFTLLQNHLISLIHPLQNRTSHVIGKCSINASVNSLFSVFIANQSISTLLLIC